MFRSVEKKPVLSFGVDNTGVHRISGDWQKSSSTTIKQKSWLSSLAAAMHALPRWPLADGLDLQLHTRFTSVSSSRQTCILMASVYRWIESKLPTKKVVVADEGGIGKTLSVSIAVRWISLREDALRASIGIGSTTADRTLGVPFASRIL